MAIIRVRFNVPDGSYCTQSNNMCKFRSRGHIKEDRYIVKCSLFSVDLVNTEYEKRDNKIEVQKCDLCLNAHTSGQVRISAHENSDEQD